MVFEPQLVASGVAGGLGAAMLCLGALKGGVIGFAVGCLGVVLFIIALWSAASKEA